MNKYIITCYTNWCGMDNEYGAVAEYEDSPGLIEVAEQLAYENFESFDCLSYIMGDLFPDEEDYTEEQYSEAYEVESDYYGYAVREFDPVHDGEWEWYGVVYDESEI